MQKIILSIFCPVLVAIIVRIALFLVGLVLSILSIIVNAKESLGKLSEAIALFDTFVWDDSWCYWIIVIILTFFGEMMIWEE